MKHKTRYTGALLIGMLLLTSGCRRNDLSSSLLSSGSPPYSSELISKENETQPPESIVYGKNTPAITGKEGTIIPDFSKVFTLSEAFLDADLVAEVIITGWLDEIINQENVSELTYFKANIIKTYKNITELDTDEITILQSGNSDWTYQNYPLFQNGDRLLLCLKSYTNERFTRGNTNCFMIAGGQQTELYIVEEDNQLYAIKRSGYLNFEDVSHRKLELDTIYNVARHIFPFSDNENPYEAAQELKKNIFLLEDIISYLDTLK